MYAAKTTMKRFGAEMLMVFLVAAAAGWGGWEATRVYSDTLMLSAQSHLFGLRAAALYAAGQGWGGSDCTEEEFPELHAFLTRKITAIPSDTYPESCSEPFQPDFYFYFHYYLNLYMGWLFYLFGISIATIHLGCILMHVVAMVMLYGCCRLLMGRILSFCVTLYVCFSPVYLLILPDFRDYAKVPFFFAALFLLGKMVSRNNTPKQLVLSALLLGMLTGIGYGFREDMLIVLPPALALIVAGVNVSSRLNIPVRLVAILVLLASFLVMHLPMYEGMKEFGGFRMAHTLLAGVTESLENNAGFGHADYDFGFLGMDTPVSASVAAYAARTGQPHPASCVTQEYGVIGLKKFQEIFRTFPADFFGRGLAAVENSFRIPENIFVAQSIESEPYEGNGVIPWLYQLQYPVDRFLSDWGLPVALLVIGILAARNSRQALCILILLLYFSAYPSLLLEYRHFFHLAFIPVFFAGTLATLVRRGVVAVIHSFKDQTPGRLALGCGKGLVAAFLLFFIFASIVGGAIWQLRAYQQERVLALLRRYDSLSLTPMAIAEIREEDAILLQLISPIVEQQDRVLLGEGQVAPAYLALRFREARRTITFSLVNTNQTFHRPCRIRLNGAGTYFFPVYDFGAVPDAVFSGVRLDPEDREFVEGLYLVEEADLLPLWPFIAIPKDHQEFLAYKTGRLDRFIETGITEARTALRRKPTEAVQAYLELIRRYPYYNAFAARAISHADRSGQENLLLAVWKHIGAVMPQRRQAAVQWLEAQADRHRKEQHWAEALRYHQAVLEMAPGELWNLVRIGEIQAATGKEQEAVDSFFSVLQRAPESPYTSAKLDALLREHETPEQVVERWQALVDAHPESAIPHVYLGMHLESLGDDKQARAAYERALQYAPGHVPALYRLGALEAMLSDFETGGAKMRDAVRLDPKYAPVVAARCAELAQYFAEREAYDKAIYLNTLAWETSPNDLAPLVRLGELFEVTGDDAAALDAYMAVLNQAPESAEPARKLHALMERMRMDAEECVRTWGRILQAHPESAIPRHYFNSCKEMNTADDYP